MSKDITTEATVTLSIQQLEGLIRKVVREELIEWVKQKPEIFNLDKNTPLHEDMEDILKRKKSGQLKFYTHAEIWDE